MDEGINLTPLEPVFVAHSLDALIAAWLEWCMSIKGEPTATGELRSHTVSGYASKIAHFQRWWHDVAQALDWRLRKRDFLAFNRWLTHESGLAYNSCKDVLRRLAQMFRWAFQNDYTKRDYSLWVPKPDGSAPLRTAIPITALSQLMQAAAASDEPRRNQAIIAIVVGTGMRRNECCMLCIEDVSLSADNSGSIAIHHAKRVSNREIQGRTVAFDKHAGVYIRAYLDALAKPTGPLFPGRWKDKPMRPESMNRIVDALIDAAGIKHQVQNLHDLRRLFVTVFRQQRRGEAHEKLLRLQVGHTSSEMTSVYDLSGEEQLQADFISPFALL